MYNRRYWPLPQSLVPSSDHRSTEIHLLFCCPDKRHRPASRKYLLVQPAPSTYIQGVKGVPMHPVRFVRWLLYPPYWSLSTEIHILYRNQNRRHRSASRNKLLVQPAQSTYIQDVKDVLTHPARSMRWLLYPPYWSVSYCHPIIHVHINYHYYV